jgi:hypothetical protein
MGMMLALSVERHLLAVLEESRVTEEFFYSPSAWNATTEFTPL